jgi:hypothetical protein
MNEDIAIHAERRAQKTCPLANTKRNDGVFRAFGFLRIFCIMVPIHERLIERVLPFSARVGDYISKVKIHIH